MKLTNFFTGITPEIVIACITVGGVIVAGVLARASAHENAGVEAMRAALSHLQTQVKELRDELEEVKTELRAARSMSETVGSKYAAALGFIRHLRVYIQAGPRPVGRSVPYPPALIAQDLTELEEVDRREL